MTEGRTKDVYVNVFNMATTINESNISRVTVNVNLIVKRVIQTKNAKNAKNQWNNIYLKKIGLVL